MRYVHRTLPLGYRHLGTQIDPTFPHWGSSIDVSPSPQGTRTRDIPRAVEGGLEYQAVLVVDLAFLLFNATHVSLPRSHCSQAAAMTTRPPPAPTSSDDGSYYDLGTYHRDVTTSKKEAQTWFDRGLIWSYGFNHEESAACFQQAIDLDPDCPMAYWGLAYSLGPNYNKPWEFFEGREMDTTVERSYRAVTHAVEISAKATAVEAALAKALKQRYPQEHKIPPDTKDPAHSAIWNKAYAEAMRQVYNAHPHDLDVVALFVDSLMNLTPWKLWDIRTGEPSPGAYTLEAKQALDKAFAQPGGDSHPGLLHLWIHLMEMSSNPEAALPRADKLRRLVPDSGHLNHMPSHLDVLCGHYADAVHANSAAIAADEKFLARAGPMNFYTLYRSHDYHFRTYAAMFSAQSRVALETVAQLEASLPEELLRVESPPMANWLEAFVAVRVHVYVRFGRWDDILALPLPRDRELYSFTTAIYLYGRGVALAALGRPDEAERERGRFEAQRAAVPRSRTLFNNTCVDILGIASAMLAGEVEYRRGNFERAFAHLREAVARDDGLEYDEPWGWMQPTRHALSALLLEQGRTAEAAAIYRADLGLDDTLPRTFQHRNNVWSLHGYHESLLKLGREDEAREVEPRLKAALEVADVPIRSSCFCRLKL
jgi:tetratricopeptide (TPR) repeat protein